MTITDCTDRAIAISGGPVPEIDTTIPSQSGYAKVLPSGGGFQDECGELIAVVQDCLAQSPPYISKANFLWKASRYPTGIDFRGIPYFTLQFPCLLKK